MRGESASRLRAAFAASHAREHVPRAPVHLMKPHTLHLASSQAAVRWVRARGMHYGLDGRRIGVIGSSSGGHLAAMLGVTAGQQLRRPGRGVEGKRWDEAAAHSLTSSDGAAHACKGVATLEGSNFQVGHYGQSSAVQAVVSIAGPARVESGS